MSFLINIWIYLIVAFGLNSEDTIQHERPSYRQIELQKPVHKPKNDPKSQSIDIVDIDRKLGTDKIL